MDYYNKIIESVSVRFLRGANLRVEKPVSIVDYTEIDNTIILLHHGTIKFGEDQELVNEGEALFLPAGKKTKLTFGGGAKKTEISK